MLEENVRDCIYTLSMEENLLTKWEKLKTERNKKLGKEWGRKKKTDLTKQFFFIRVKVSQTKSIDNTDKQRFGGKEVTSWKIDKELSFEMCKKFLQNNVWKHGKGYENRQLAEKQIWVTSTHTKRFQIH